ncbi:MAG: hypothetical protein KKG09_01450 [Verrucomicrobia bacterium]|nr:hypothetical protein [Verrucomicrobiota bacterium]MCG2678972.1 hypothetical protein [Kiritimatiellia bacterium]MBU4247628.1 hypothetical protein [Verrucomicrobiota bacterium]MBU4290809.1 hypothetical protein [Verrucomicrobiota bacterium]MBU4428355.1 hypothetical protein [Verrucomicrobiota bacterium]
MEKKICKGAHRGHLCVLASADKLDEIKKLACKPRYICFNCGRVANCGENLCNPMALD